MAFTAITSGEADANSPADATLWGKVKANFDWLKGLFDGTTGHAHTGAADDGPLIASVADEAITPAKLGYAAEEETGKIFDLPAERTFTAGGRGSYQLIKSVEVEIPGTYRVTFEVYDNSDDPCTAQIFVDGVATGTERTSTGSYASYTEDIFAASKADIELRVQIASGTGSDYIYVRNFSATLKFLANTTIRDADL